MSTPRLTQYTMAKRASLTSAARPPGTRAALPVLGSEEWDSAGELQLLDIAAIDPSPYQPREAYDEKTLAELAASIQDRGVIQPILVRPKEEQRYELMAVFPARCAASQP